MRGAITFTAAALLLALLAPPAAHAVTIEAPSFESNRSTLKYDQTKAHMELQQFNVAGDQIDLAVTLEKNGQLLEKRAELTAFLSTFDDGTTAILASEPGDPELKVDQVRIDNTLQVICVTLFERETGNCYSAEFSFATSNDIASSVEELFGAAGACSREHALEMLSIGNNDSSAGGYETSGSIDYADANDVSPHRNLHRLERPYRCPQSG